MSDFLDRVVARVIGGDTAKLMPRVPSIYEPSQATANGGLEQSLSVTAVAASAQREGVATAADATSAGRTRAHAPLFASREDGIGKGRIRVDTTLDERVGPSSAIHPEGAAQASVAKHTVIEPLEHRAKHELQPDAPSPARAAPITVTARAVAVPDRAVGVLLPPEQPVFGTSNAIAVRHAATPERSRAPAAHAHSEVLEPVVHVSIGRIEVRAAAASASTPRRQSGAPVDRLGDYLRERNKAKP